MRVLLVEDSPRLQQSVGKALHKSGYAVDTSGDGEEGFWLAETNDYDAIILDIMLPKLDGLTLLRRLRKMGRQTGVLLLTAKDTVEDRVDGLQMGADDYLVKPFALEELLARVQVLCRRQYGHATNRLTVGDLEIDMNARRAVRAGQPLELTAREFMLLEYLAQRKGQIVSRGEIETHIYNDGAELMSNVVDSAVCVLRRKLALPGRPRLIETKRGMGYVLNPSA
ncbi:MAG: response regulator transcription factor [Verrucomicrobia bacterium]|nr:response regulator transcription factor [Verrucomicrobiota bacterium]MDE3098415.1 response regulator transcription factor [Verrucomicrobiota bacterium]